MNTCDVCLKEFKRRDNMLRHKKNLHTNELEKGTVPTRTESELSAVESTESELFDVESTESETDQWISEADEASDAEMSTGGEQCDPWESVVQKAFEKCQDQFEEEVTRLNQRKNLSETQARQRVYKDMRGNYRKAVTTNFTERMAWFDAIRRDSVYKAIKRTATYFMDLDDYSSQEAWKSAISQRKYLFDTILAEYYPPEIEEDEREEEDESESDSDEPPTKRIKYF